MVFRGIIAVGFGIFLCACPETNTLSGAVVLDAGAEDVAVDDGVFDCDSCIGDAPFCDWQSQRCVGCLMNAHCGGDTPICDPVDYSCVGCRVNMGFEDCDGHSCNVFTRQCTDTKNGSLSECRPCVSDEECGYGDYSSVLRCVPMEEQGVVTGHYCLRDEVLGPNSGCRYTYSTHRYTTSLGGVTATYCFPDPADGC